MKRKFENNDIKKLQLKVILYQISYKILSQLKRI